MSYINKSFTSNLDGTTVKIVNEIDSNIMQLDNGNRVSIARLKDPSFWTENIDPSSFFNRDTTVYENFVNTIKSIPDSQIKESRETGAVIKESGIYDRVPKDYINENHLGTTNDIDVPVYNQDPEEEKKELLKKYVGNSNAQAVAAQAAKMREFLNEDEIDVKLPPPVQVQVERSEEGEVTQIVVNDVEHHQVTRQYIQQENPNTQMFKGIKRNTDFKVKLEINNKIPRTDFISMWEDSYEASMIEYLAQEFTNSLLSDPNLIKEQITEQLRELVYGKQEKPKVIAKPAKKAAAKKATKVEAKVTKDIKTKKESA